MFIDLFAKQLNNALNLHSDVNIREQELRFMLDFFLPPRHKGALKGHERPQVMFFMYKDVI